MSRKQVLVYRALPAEQLDRIRQEHDVVVADPRIADQEVAFLEALPQAQGLIGSSYSIDEALLARAPRLEVVSSISVGVDKYQIDAFQRRAITLCHNHGVLTDTVADLLFDKIGRASCREKECWYGWI